LSSTPTSRLDAVPKTDTFILSLIICLSFGLSAVARRCGASRWLAVGVPTLPALVAFIYFAIRHDIDFGPHGGIVPAWMAAGIVLLIVAVVSFLAAVAVGG
jgi:hypothetical protein